MHVCVSPGFHPVPSHPHPHPQTSGTSGAVERRQATEFCANYGDGESEEWMVAIGNEAVGGQSAATISAEQVCMQPHVCR